jgi:hypothetical protein
MAQLVQLDRKDPLEQPGQLALRVTWDQLDPLGHRATLDQQARLAHRVFKV